LKDFARARVDHSTSLLYLGNYRSTIKVLQEKDMTFTKLLLASLFVLVIFSSRSLHAAEQRCDELGANCVCSEPFNTATFVGGPDFWNPSDSTTKECSVEAASIGGAVVRTSATITGSNDASAIAALPSGHSVNRFLRANDGHTGTFFAGNGTAVSSNFVRLAARWYLYHTSNFEFKLEGSCDNSKVMEFDNDARIDYTGGFHTYNYLRFNPSVDCCVSGPGPSHNVPTSAMKGKWWRFEAILTNRSGPNFNVVLYGKNITDNGPELEIINLSNNGSVANLTPPSLMSAMITNNHRFGTCNGWLGISHYMMAGWTTNAGQRIGAASEVEGGGANVTLPSSPTLPNSPTSLTVH
jgi:hypothetical protein